MLLGSTFQSEAWPQPQHLLAWGPSGGFQSQQTPLAAPLLQSMRGERELDLELLDSVTWPDYVWEWLRYMGAPARCLLTPPCICSRSTDKRILQQLLHSADGCSRRAVSVDV